MNAGQRPRRPEVISVCLAHKACLGLLLLPPGLNASPSQSYPQQNVAGTHLKCSKVPCVKKQHDWRGLNPGPPDPGFEVLTAWKPDFLNWPLPPEIISQAQRRNWRGSYQIRPYEKRVVKAIGSSAKTFLSDERKRKMNFLHSWGVFLLQIFRKMVLIGVQSTLSKTDTFGTGTKCPS